MAAPAAALQLTTRCALKIPAFTQAGLRFEVLSLPEAPRKEKCNVEG
jgi:hypothetical protein